LKREKTSDDIGIKGGNIITFFENCVTTSGAKVNSFSQLSFALE